MQGKRKNYIPARIILDIILIVCVFQGWWFIALPVGIVGAFLFSFYPEMIFAGFIYDSLFGGPDMGVKGYLGTIVCLLALAIIMESKSLIRK